MVLIIYFNILEYIYYMTYIIVKATDNVDWTFENLQTMSY